MRHVLRKSILALSVVTLSMVGVIGGSQAGDYPSDKIIKFVVPFGAGGGTDRWARVISSVAYDNFGQAWHVQNRGGAGATIGWRYVLDQPADGYTLLSGSITPSLTVMLEKKPPFGPLDIKMVGFYATTDAHVTALPGKPWSTWDGALKYAKANPGKLTVGGTTAQSMAAASIFDQAGVKVTIVPYPGTGKAVADLLGGHISFAMATPATLISLGDQITCVVNASDRANSKKVQKKIGNPPWINDLGYKGFGQPRWIGVHPDTPQAIVDKIEAGLAKMMKDKSLVRLVRSLGEGINYVGQAEASAKYKDLVERSKALLHLMQ